MENINRDGHKLLFKGEEFRLGQLLAQVRTAPPIEVKLDELNLVGLNKLATDDEEAKRLIAKHVPVLPEYVEQFVLFYKQEGKFTVLLGHIKVRQALEAGNIVLRGKLISGPVLKKCRIEKPEPVAIAAPTPAPNPQFNAPRFTQDTRRPPQERRGISEQRDSTSSAPRGGAQHKRYAVSGGNIIRKDPRSRV